jgi:hypothetical protein
MYPMTGDEIHSKKVILKYESQIKSGVSLGYKAAHA